MVHTYIIIPCALYVSGTIFMHYKFELKAFDSFVRGTDHYLLQICPSST